jgi:hypothetical protein
MLNIMCLYISTYRIMCAVLNMTFFSNLISCFHVTFLGYCLSDSEMVPVAPVITGIILLLLLYGLFNPFIGLRPLRFRVFETTVLLWRQASPRPAPKWKASASLFVKQLACPVWLAPSTPRLTPASLAKQFLGWSGQGGWGWRDLGHTWERKEMHTCVW